MKRHEARARDGLSCRWLLTMLLASACGASATSHGRLYQQELAYTGCMRSHGVPDFPAPKPGPDGTLTFPLNPPAGMLARPGYDAAFRACLKRAVIGARSARYRAIALSALKQAECMRTHGIASYPSPAALNGGLHVPDTTMILDTHTAVPGRREGSAGSWNSWMLQWWWPTGSGSRDRRAGPGRRRRGGPAAGADGGGVRGRGGRSGYRGARAGHGY
jgi:hypothetical protein